MKKEIIYGHLLAIIAIFIWGTTFVSTKILLKYLNPEEILLFRFLLAFLILLVLYPRRIKVVSFKEELLFLMLGLTGIALYFWTENIALKFTYASNVGLISSSIPIFTALIAHATTKDEKFTANFLMGFIVSMTGIFMVIYNSRVLKLNPIGDILALTSAVMFAVYSVLIRKVSSRYNPLIITRKIFFYGVLSILPIVLIKDISISKLYIFNINIYGNLVFLALLASVFCFLIWNKSVMIIGSVKATNYIYLVPLIAMITSVIVINEKVNSIMIIGGFLIFIGVYINNKNFTIKWWKYHQSQG